MRHSSNNKMKSNTKSTKIRCKGLRRRAKMECQARKKAHLLSLRKSSRFSDNTPKTVDLVTPKNKNKIIILSAIDNLIKGGAGQAIQNMNMKFNFPKDAGFK